MAWDRTQRGLGVTWVEAHISLAPAERTATLARPEPTRVYPQALLRGVGASGMLFLQALRAATGKLAWAMDIVVRIRGAVAILYAVVAGVARDGASGREASRAARRRVGRRVKRGPGHLRRARLPVLWLIELFASLQGPAGRVIEWRPARPQLCIFLDASPRGLGAVRAHSASDKPWQWPASSLDKDDEEMLDSAAGSSTAQQVAETPALPLALRIWFRSCGRAPPPWSSEAVAWQRWGWPTSCARPLPSRSSWRPTWQLGPGAAGAGTRGAAVGAA